ncbi:hypothetical protein BBW69_09085 [Neisseria sp. RH3002v2f]|nr:hypothetical protein [Neisseria sp. RH3002v2f]
MPSEPRYGKLRQQKTDGKYAVRFYFHPRFMGQVFRRILSKNPIIFKCLKVKKVKFFLNNQNII